MQRFGSKEEFYEFINNFDFVNNQTEFEVKLIDFGLAAIADNEFVSNETSGTLCYCAPEVLLGQRQDFKADVWSLGCILFQMVSG